MSNSSQQGEQSKTRINNQLCVRCLDDTFHNSTTSPSGWIYENYSLKNLKGNMLPCPVSNQPGKMNSCFDFFFFVLSLRLGFYLLLTFCVNFRENGRHFSTKKGSRKRLIFHGNQQESILASDHNGLASGKGYATAWKCSQIQEILRLYMPK